MRVSSGHLTRFAVASGLALTVAAVSIGLPASPASAGGPYTISAGALNITLDGTGTVTGLVDGSSGRDYAMHDHERSLIQLVADGVQELPTALAYDSSTSTYVFTFGDISTDVSVKVTPKTSYATFEVTDVSAPANVDVSTLFWGPVTTSIAKTVGEIAGVAYDSDFAIGIKQLNDKTIGGWVPEQSALTYKDTDFTAPMPFEWSSAARTSWGSILQSYTYDNSVDRTRGAGITPAYSHWMANQFMPALSGDEGRIVGSKIALYGAARSQILNTISAVQTGEGLIHPTVGGQWDKTSQKSSQSFLVLNDLKTTNVAQASQYANAAGLDYIYSLIGTNGPWTSSGHFQFNAAFGGPNNSDETVASLVDTADSYGVKVGVHTLSNFVSGADPYVTPIPDAGLAGYGSVHLTRALGTTDTEIYVDGDLPFSGGKGRILHIGDEIAGYTSISQVNPSEWKLTGVVRNSSGTTATAQPIGASVQRLVGNEYGGFIGGLPIIEQIGTRLATIFNTTGIKAMSFDGMEGASQAGYGTYPTARLINGMYRQLDSTSDFISEASNITPNTWDAQTRVSWGESSTSLATRYNYMAYFQRNFLPAMIGWLPLSGDQITLEANLAKIAGWNAGTGFTSSVAGLASMSNSAAILDLVKQWETARNTGAFTESQKTRLRDMTDCWHLSTVNASRWSLQQIDCSAGSAIGEPEDVFVGNADPASSEVNLAYSATASASSQFNSKYQPANAIDGVTGQDGYGEWAALGETNPFLKLTWNAPQTVNKITLQDRPRADSNATSGTLIFSDGSVVKVAGIPTDGSPVSITFPSRAVTWIKFQTTGGAGSNVGLSELEVFDAPSDLSTTAIPTASSEYSPSYAPSKGIDTVIGMTGTGEWASSGELTPWYQIDWGYNQAISKVTFFDRPTPAAWAESGTLFFSDGSTVAVAGIPNNGTAKSVTFPVKNVRWMRFEVTGSSGSNVGLSEIAVTNPDPSNLATSATASGSSTFDSRYLPDNVTDAVTGVHGMGEWSSAGDTDPWVQLDWASAQTVSQVTFFDRPTTAASAGGGTLYFSDESSVSITGIPDDGKPLTVNFPPRSITWMKFQADGGSGTNVGLSELEVRNPGPQNLALASSATASTIYDYRYSAAKVLDGITGQTGTGEWASLGEVAPWIQLTWDGDVTINKIALYDRVHTSTCACAGTLLFSDETTVSVTGIPNDGTLKTVTFPDKTVSWVRFQVSGGVGTNVGLAELQVFHD